MREIRFYHLAAMGLERALPSLLEKCLERGLRAVVRLQSTERLAFFDDHLWTYDDRSFLPHGSSRDGEADLQPIWLTTIDENPNGAQVLFLVEGTELPDGIEPEDAEDFDIACDLFDGGREDSIRAARRRWSRYRTAGFPLVYYQQQPNGAWTERHRSEGRA